MKKKRENGPDFDNDCFFGARPESVAKSDHSSRFCGLAGVSVSGSNNLVLTYDVLNYFNFVLLSLVFHFIACMVVLRASVLYIECTLLMAANISVHTPWNQFIKISYCVAIDMGSIPFESPERIA